LDLSIWIASFGSSDWRDELDLEDARQGADQLGDLGREATYKAEETDETFGTFGSATGFFLPDVVTPGPEAQVAKGAATAGKAIVGVAAAKIGSTLLKKAEAGVIKKGVQAAEKGGGQ